MMQLAAFEGVYHKIRISFLQIALCQGDPNRQYDVSIKTPAHEMPRSRALLMDNEAAGWHGDYRSSEQQC